MIRFVWRQNVRSTRRQTASVALALALCLAFTLIADESKPSTPPAERVKSPLIENLYRLSNRIYSGGQPEGNDAFESLEMLGIRTIISVDGAAPDVDTARLHNMRYVHLPIGYDGVPAPRALAMIKAVRDLPGPVFIHCHHGKHRGPAAAALCAVAVDNWSREQALAWMSEAGTAPEYRGLYRSVKSLGVPTDEELKAAAVVWPEQATVSTLVENMIAVDHDWDRLKAFRDADFETAEDDPVTPAQSARELTERFRELARSTMAIDRGEKFAAAAREAGQAADKLEQTLQSLAKTRNKPVLEEAQAALRRVGQSCTGCHRVFRDDAQARANDS